MAVVIVSGELDLATAPRLQDALVGLIVRGVRAVTVDMAGLGFIDSTGLSVLIKAMTQLRDQGGSLTLRSPTTAAQRVLEVTGLARVFAIG